MLGQPIYFLTPDVVGVHLKGKLRAACTATDLVLTITELLRKAKVVGKFVEFFGEGTASLAVPDRATIANMAPDYGATMGFFPVDDSTIEYFRGTGRTETRSTRFAAYFKAQGMFGIPQARTDRLQRRCSSSTSPPSCPSLAGPKRPQDRIDLDKVKPTFQKLFSSSGRGERLRQEERGSCQTLQDLRRPGARPRRRADRGDHFLHQHLEPGRAARRGAAREESGRARPYGQAARQDLARAGIARRDRVPAESRPAALPREARLRARRLRLHDLHRQRRPARAADRGSDRARTIWSARRCSPATATSRRASTRTSAPTSSPRRRSWSRSRSPARFEIDLNTRTAREIERRPGRVTSATSGRAPTRCAR